MVYGLRSLILESSPSFRKVFPSYDWDEDVWRVNQIINLPHILGRENIGFMKNVPNEEVKRSDILIKNWIDDNMNGCSCLVVFVGEKTYQSKWVKYEIEQARERGMGRIIVGLEGMNNRYGIPSAGGMDPYIAHGFYASTPSPLNYTIKKYSWNNDNGIENIKFWIEDACQRARR